MSDQSRWPRKVVAVTSLHLDSRNPRIRRADTGSSPRDLLQHLFDHEGAISVAESIASRGFFPTEPLLAVEEDGSLVVVEGNRRLAALKGLREPTLLKDTHRRQLERLKSRIPSDDFLRRAPVIIAPSRRAADRLLVGRHTATAVRTWQSEDRASFILNKLEEGYTTEELEDQLGLDTADITAARQTRAVTEMARSLDLEDAVRAKLDAPRTKVFSTIERVFDSAPGREFLRLERNAEHGILVHAPREKFRTALTRIVEDVVLGRMNSRSLNTAEDIKSYFETWGPEGKLPKSAQALSPRDVIGGDSVASPAPREPRATAPRNSPVRDSVIPKSFRVVDGTEKIKLLRGELRRLNRKQYPSCGAVMLRVFLEMAILHHLERAGRLSDLKKELGNQLRFNQPTFSQMLPDVRKIVKKQFAGTERSTILRALNGPRDQPFTVESLNAFVHGPKDIPSEGDILAFWEAIEPLMAFLLGRHEIA